jgi:hypothetical protein
MSTLLASSLPMDCFLLDIVHKHQQNLWSKRGGEGADECGGAEAAGIVPRDGYFIDRDPLVFRALVAFCRTGIWERPAEVGPRLFQAELRGYGVEWEDEETAVPIQVERREPSQLGEKVSAISVEEEQSESEIDSDDDSFEDDDDEDDEDGEDAAGPTVPSAAQELEALLAADVAYAVHTGTAAAMAPGVVDRVKREKLSTTVSLFAGLCEREGLECVPALAATNIVPNRQWEEAVAAVQASSVPHDLLVDILFGYSFAMYRLGHVPAALRVLTLSKRCGYDNAAADTLAVVIEDSQSNALKAATSGVVLAAALGAIYYMFWKQ